LQREDGLGMRFCSQIEAQGIFSWVPLKGSLSHCEIWVPLLCGYSSLTLSCKAGLSRNTMHIIIVTNFSTRINYSGEVTEFKSYKILIKKLELKMFLVFFF
jgi:hypothetical protein